MTTPFHTTKDADALVDVQERAGGVVVLARPGRRSVLGRIPPPTAPVRRHADPPGLRPDARRPVAGPRDELALRLAIVEAELLAEAAVLQVGGCPHPMGRAHMLSLTAERARLRDTLDCLHALAALADDRRT